MKILIFPGLDGTGTLHSEVVELLSPKHEVIALHYEPSVHRYEDLETKLEACLPADDYIIVAESFSGPLAVMVASKKPIGLRGVVFVATFARTPRKVPKLLTYLVDIAPTKFRLLSQLAQPFLMGKWSTPEFSAKFQKVLRSVPASTIAGRLREVLRVNVVEKFAYIDIPTIYLAATNDRLVPAEMASDFDRSSSAVFEVEGPHFLMQANAKESAKHISSFAAKFD